MTEVLKLAFAGFFKTLAVAVVTVVFIFVGLSVAYKGTTEHDQMLREAALKANIAIVCTLALPIDPTKGRDEARLNSVCLVPNGVPAFDANDNGVVETIPGG